MTELERVKEILGITKLEVIEPNMLNVSIPKTI